MTDAMIRVPAGVRDRLAVLAEAQGTSIRAMIQQFAESTLTAEELNERAEKARAYIATHFGVDVTPEDEEAIQRTIDALDEPAAQPAAEAA